MINAIKIFKKFLFLILLSLLIFGFKDLNSERPIDYIAFQAGEYLKYDLHFGAIHAGEAILQIDPKLATVAGHSHYHIQITGYSFSVFDVFYKVRDKYESYVNTSTHEPTIFLRNVLEGSYTKKEYYIFNHSKNQVVSDGNTYNVPANTQDLVSAFYYLRCIDFSDIQIGTFIPITTFFDNEIFPIGVTFKGREIINTSYGKVKCLVFKPKLIEGRVFKSQSDMILYVTDDKNHIPIRIQSAVFLGNVKADLIDYKNLKFPFSSIVSK